MHLIGFLLFAGLCGYTKSIFPVGSCNKEGSPWFASNSPIKDGSNQMRRIRLGKVTIALLLVKLF